MAQHKRHCPECNKEICYTTKYSLKNANMNKTLCTSCRQRGERNHTKKRSPEQIENFKSNFKKTYDKKYGKINNEIINLILNTDLTYDEISKKLLVSKGKINSLIKKNNISRNRKPTPKQIKTYRNNIYKNIINKNLNIYGGIKTKEHYEKIFKSRFGYDYSEYLSSINEYKKYYNEVRYKTMKNIEKYTNLFENLDLIGRCGEKNKYQIDHIYSIKEGYKNKITPNLISHPVNLRVITWEENSSKGSKCEATIDFLIDEAAKFLLNNCKIIL